VTAARADHVGVTPVFVKEEHMAIPASILDFLQRNQAQYTPISHPFAYTAQGEAAAAHVPGREWAKAVVCIADDHPVLAVLPAPSKVDLQRLNQVVHAHSLRLANEAEFKQFYTDCEVGAMPPFGPLYQQPVFIDGSLTTDREIVFSAGSHHDAIRMPYREFERLVRPTVAAFGTDSRVATTRSAKTAVTDAVCGMDIEEENVWGRSEYKGETYHFCSQHCKMEFDDNPGAYLRSQ
jgi:Ala-tRNA(Pro) deacylase